MAGKITEYVVEATAFEDGDKVDMSKRVSTFPDTFESQKVSFGAFRDLNLFGLDGQTLGSSKTHQGGGFSFTIEDVVSRYHGIDELEDTIAAQWNSKLGVQAFVINSKGNTLIGGAGSPASRLHIVGKSDLEADKALFITGATGANELIDLRNNGQMGIGGSYKTDTALVVKNPNDETFVLSLLNNDDNIVMQMHQGGLLYLNNTDGTRRHELRAEGHNIFDTGGTKVIYLNTGNGGFYDGGITFGATSAQTGGSKIAIVNTNAGNAILLKTVDSTLGLFTSIKVTGDNRVMTGAPLTAVTTSNQPNSTFTDHVNGSDELIRTWKDSSGTLKTLNLGTFT